MIIKVLNELRRKIDENNEKFNKKYKEPNRTEEYNNI